MAVTIPLIFTDDAARDGDVRARQALLPRTQTSSAAGLDLCAAEGATLEPGDRRLIPTGVAIALPDGFEGQVRPRSGLALHHGVTVLNAPGTIDADYRGPIGVVLINLGREPFRVERGDRIAQLVVAPVERVELSVVLELPPTGRGDGGFGSTGRGQPGGETGHPSRGEGGLSG